MKISIICVGKVKEMYFADAVREYNKRMSSFADIMISEVTDEKIPDGISEAGEQRIQMKEAERIKRCMKERMYTIALDRRGKQYDSLQFSDRINRLMLERQSHIAFLIGGSLGLHPSVVSSADECLSFSKMTFPHQLMRVILMEQIYRAVKIIKNEPYHK